MPTVLIINDILTAYTVMVYAFVKRNLPDIWYIGFTSNPHWDQQPTTPAIRATVSAMEVALALVKQMASGLGAHPLVNVSVLVTINSVFSCSLW